MRVFLDTNVLFSGIYSDKGPPARLLDLVGEGAFAPVVSTAVMNELVHNMRRKAPLKVPLLAAFLAGIEIEIRPDPPRDAVEVWRTATFGTDAPIIAAALEAELDYFCTGDRRILTRGRRGDLPGLRVVSPAELVSIIESSPA